MNVARAQKAAAQAELASAQAETEIARQQLSELDVLLDYSTLKAPFAGVVTDRNLDPGDLVRQSNEVGLGRPLFVIMQMDKVRVSFPVPEIDAPLVNRGDQVTLTFPSFPSETPIVASVTRMSGSLDPMVHRPLTT